MVDIADDEQHVTDSLGLYYMDALDRPQGDMVERHLQSCPSCRSTADEVVETIAALELLSDDDRRELSDNFGALRRAGTSSPGPTRILGDVPSGDAAPRPISAPSVQHSPGRVVRPRQDNTPELPTGVPDKGSPPGRSGGLPGKSSPPNRPDSAARRPPLKRNRRKTALYRAGAMLAVVLVVAGLAIGALLRSPDGSSTSVTTVAATAANDGTGASLSISATQREGGGVTIHATVNGLKAAKAYRLYAVTTDGQEFSLQNWTSDGKVQELSGGADVSLGALSYFTVVQAGAGRVVSAYLTSAEQPAPTAS